MGCYGNPYIKTPVLDSFFRHSIRLEHFFVSPVCSPTRASLMTGRYYLRTGVYDTFFGRSIMDSAEHTLAELFQAAGYRTGLFGKWHLGDHYPYRAQDQGFERAFYHGAGGMGQPGDHPYNWQRRDSSYFDPMLYDQGQPKKFKGFFTDIFTDQALAFMREKNEKPFFTYLAYNAPHSPLMAPEKYLKMYENLPFDSLLCQSHTEDNQPQREKHQEAAKKVYAMVSNIDDNFGRIVDQLQQQGEWENTIVMFLSDNGPQYPRYNYCLNERKSSA